MPLLLFGLDGEMSAANFEDGGRLIQIGLAAHATPDGSIHDTPPTFSSLINPGTHHWDPRAAAVHGYSPEEVAAAPPAAHVDEQTVAWLQSHGVARDRSAVPVGFNVGAFDLPHVAAVLPRTARLLARRTVDLNAICFTLAGMPYQGTPATWSGWKRMASTYAERTIAATTSRSETAHDAGYDALLHLHAWRFLRAATHGAPLPIPQDPVTGYARDVKTAANRLLQTVGLPDACAITGYSPPQLKGWAAGGRTTDPRALQALTAALEETAKKASSPH